MSEIIPANSKALVEALELSDTILKEIELGEIPLSNIALKCARLAKLLNDFDYQHIMQYEVGGFPCSPTGFSHEVWKLIEKANRSYQQKDFNSGEIKVFGYMESIGQLEAEIEYAKQGVAAAKDRNISISSANPSQHIFTPMSNQLERDALKNKVSTNSKRLSERRSFIYYYVLRKHYELKFSGIADDLFSRIRERVDSTIGKLIPNSVQKFNAIYENLRTENPENWANSVHSCRRILEELADVLFPPQNDDRIKNIDGKEISIKLGAGNYKNRLLCYVEDRSKSNRFNEIVGSALEYLADRLDSIFQAANKGTHSTIVSKQEADRCVIYTYLIVGDILSI